MDQILRSQLIEHIQNSNTMHITKVFNDRALFSDGTITYRNPEEPMPQDNVKIRIRTARGNVSIAILAIGDRRIPMYIGEQTDLFDYYETNLVVEDKIIKYYFIVWCADEYYFYNNIGVSREHHPEYDMSIIPGFKTPEWTKGAVFYQIFVDRFRNGAGANGVMNREYRYLNTYTEKVTDWYKKPSQIGVNEFYGGDLQGVMEKLDYLQELGIEVIYMNPIFVSPSNHKYDTQDYDYVDPHLAVIVSDKGECLAEGDTDNSHASRYINCVTDKKNLEASNRYFATLVEEIHRRGMRIVMDGVFNHCGSFNKWMDKDKIYINTGDYAKGAYIDENSPYRNYFDFEDKSKAPSVRNYAGWWGHDTLPKLNYENSPELQEEIMRIARKWVSPPFNADGWRLDVAADLGHSPEFNHGFWKRFRDEVKTANPEAIILAEHYGDPADWLQGDQWDTVMNYDAFMEPLTWFLTGMEKHSDEFRQDMLNNAEAFFGAMGHFMSKFQKQSLDTAMNELSNHDHSRFMTRTNRTVGRTNSVGPEAADKNTNPAVMREAVVVQMTWPGAPTVYYGDEAGLCGWTDPDNRRGYPWGREDFSLIRFHKELIGIHKSYNALRKGSIKFLAAQYGVIAYGRFDETDKFVVALNNTEEAINVDIPVWEIDIADKQPLVRLVQTNDTGYSLEAAIYRAEHGVLKIKLGPFSAVVMKNLPNGLA